MSTPSLQLRAKAEIERRKRLEACPIIAPYHWQDWLTDLFPAYVTASFAQRHIDLWEWAENIAPDVMPRPFVAIWPRGGAKSTTAEMIVSRMGARNARRYVWYVSSTQDKADKHVENVAALLEKSSVEKYYPDLASRAVGKYGNSKGWRRERLRTSSGLTVDALGLDVGARGAKVEDQRPDMIILDDVDEKSDSAATTLKKIDTITTSILPAGSNDCAVLFIQNLIHPESIASRLVDGRADFMQDRVVSGPYPAVENMVCEQIGGKFVITSGDATWDGQNIQTAQAQISLWGYSAFLKEAQHEVEKSGGTWGHLEFMHIERQDAPDFERCSVWVDPAVTATDQSDSMGISAGGLANGKLYGLYWWEGITSPEDAIRRAIRKAIEIRADRVGVETDQGGDTWQSVYYRALESVQAEFGQQFENRYADIEDERQRKALIDGEIKKILWPAFASDKAGAGYGSKVERNSRMLTSYESGQVIHVIGTHSAIEKSLLRFPNKPLDLADSMFWLWNDLLGGSSWFVS